MGHQIIRFTHRLAVSLAAIAVLLSGSATSVGAWWILRTPDLFFDIDASGDVVHNDLGPGNEKYIRKRSGASGSEIWTYDLPISSASLNLGMDTAGDVVVVRRAPSSAAVDQVPVVKLSGVSGTESWVQTIEGTSAVRSIGRRLVAFDAAGDVIIAGALKHLDTDEDLLVAKLDGGTGAELWRAAIAQSGERHFVTSVAVDGAGDVIVLGRVRYESTVIEELVLFKVSGATGAKLWLEAMGRAFEDDMGGLAVDGSGDVIFSMRQNGNEVMKVAGASGAEVWRRQYSSGCWAHDVVAVDGQGDVFIGGASEVSRRCNFTVYKADGATGAEIWRQVVRSPSWGSVSGLSVAGDGDIVATGAVKRSFFRGNTAFARLSGDTGETVWQTTHYPTSDIVGGEIQVDATRAVFGSMRLRSSAPSGLVRLDYESGAVGTLSGRRLTFVDDANDSAQRRLVVISKDPALVSGPIGPTSDPILGGATLKLSNPTTMEEAVFVLPPGDQFWRERRGTSFSKGYVYRDPTGINGPCTLVRLKPGGSFRAICTGRNGAIPFDLDEPSQESLVFSFRFGTAAAQCMTFVPWNHRRRDVDFGTGNPGPIGRFSTGGDSNATAMECPLP